MYTTVEALMLFAGFDEDEGNLEALIKAATEIIENYTQRVFQVDDETDQIFSRLHGVSTRFDGSTLYFYEELAAEASAITDSPTVTYLPENGPPYWGCYKSDGSWAYPTVTVTGYWGAYKTPPPDIEVACLRLSKWLYDMKEGGGSEAIFTPEGQVLLPSGLPKDIITILNPHRKVTVV